MNAQDFAASYLDIRDGLFFKRVLGEELTVQEQDLILSVDWALDILTRRPGPLPSKVLEAIAQVCASAGF